MRASIPGIRTPNEGNDDSGPHKGTHQPVVCYFFRVVVGNRMSGVVVFGRFKKTLRKRTCHLEPPRAHSLAELADFGDPKHLPS